MSDKAIEQLRDAQAHFLIDYCHFGAALRCYKARRLEESMAGGLVRPPYSDLYVLGLFLQEYNGYEDLAAFLWSLINYRTGNAKTLIEGLFLYSPDHAVVDHVLQEAGVRSGADLFELLRLENWVPAKWATVFPQIDLAKVLRRLCEFWVVDCSRNHKREGVLAYNSLKHFSLVVRDAKRCVRAFPPGPGVLVVTPDDDPAGASAPFSIYCLRQQTDGDLEQRQRSIEFSQHGLRLLAALFLVNECPPDNPPPGDGPGLLRILMSPEMRDVMEFIAQVSETKEARCEPPPAGDRKVPPANGSAPVDPLAALQGVEPMVLLDYAIFGGALRAFTCFTLQQGRATNQPDLARRLHHVAVVQQECLAYEDLATMLGAMLAYRSATTRCVLEGLVLRKLRNKNEVLSDVLEAHSITTGEDLCAKLDLKNAIPASWATVHPEIDIGRGLVNLCRYVTQPSIRQQQNAGLSLYRKIKHGAIVVKDASTFCNGVGSGPAAITMPTKKEKKAGTPDGLQVLAISLDEQQSAERIKTVNVISQTVRLLAALHVTRESPGFVAQHLGVDASIHLFRHPGMRDVVELLKNAECAG